MARKCYISFKTEDIAYKNYIQTRLNVDMIDKSLNDPINSFDEDYIMRVIRQDYLADSTVTLFLIGAYGAENRGDYEQRFIKKELQASLYHGVGNTQNGILGIVLPSMVNLIYGNAYICGTCGGSHNYVVMNDNTVIKEFGCNYYVQKNQNPKCSWSEDNRFCVLVKWDDFVGNPEEHIEQAYQKTSHDISNYTKVRP